MCQVARAPSFDTRSQSASRVLNGVPSLPNAHGLMDKYAQAIEEVMTDLDKILTLELP